MSERTAFDDFVMIQEAIKILESYKLGRVSEKDCLIKILTHFHDHGEIIFRDELFRR